MSTWTSERLRRAALSAPLLMALAGCLDGLGLGAAREAPEVTRVAGGSVAIGGPRGYCIDPIATRDRADGGAFVLLGSCAALNGTAQAQHPDRIAVLTASVSGPGGGARVADSLDEMAALFATDPGRALLSRSGDAASVEVMQTSARDGILFLHLRDTSPFDGAAVAEEYWRAVLDLGDRMAMLSVIPLASPTLEPAAARAVLEGFLLRVMRENAAAPEPLAPPPSTGAELREAAARIRQGTAG